jgi:acyl-CoA synthetase (NDP forming)
LGFNEIENKEGKRRQEEIIARTEKGGIRVIGPNCPGLYRPSGGLTFNCDYENAPGPVSMISQSGNAAQGIQEGASRGASEFWTSAVKPIC